MVSVSLHVEQRRSFVHSDLRTEPLTRFAALFARTKFAEFAAGPAQAGPHEYR
jgi:hypothetical protein